MCDLHGELPAATRRLLGRRTVLTAGIAAPFAYRLVRSDVASAAMAVTEPRVNPRSSWGADLAPKGALLPEEVRFLLVHHTQDPGSDYEAADVPGVIRQIFDFHTGSEKGWPDVAYNFFIDKFGTIWEARSGSLDAARAGKTGVRGDATGGNQGYSQLCCFIGDFTSVPPPQPALDSMTAMLAWLANQYRVAVTPGSTVTFESLGSNKHPAGSEISTPTITGHRFMSETDCPGDGSMPFVNGALQTVTAFMTAAGGPSPVATSVPITTTTTPTTSAATSAPEPSGASAISSGASGPSALGTTGSSGSPATTSHSPRGTGAPSTNETRSAQHGTGSSKTTGIWSGSSAIGRDDGTSFLPIGIGVGLGAAVGSAGLYFLARRKLAPTNQATPPAPAGLALLPPDDQASGRYRQYGPISFRIGQPSPDWASGGVGGLGSRETSAILCAGSHSDSVSFLAAKVDALLDASDAGQESLLAGELDTAFAQAIAENALGGRAMLMVATPHSIYAAIAGESFGAAVRSDATMTRLSHGRLRRINRATGTSVLVSFNPIPAGPALRGQLTDLANLHTPTGSESWWSASTIAVLPQAICDDDNELGRGVRGPETPLAAPTISTTNGQK